ncbi:MAG: hypothetical protein CTY16_12500 [Methylobacter sp.]|nr:MAG: hypothetical protein CTY16_12500 [Methylobacter sp.]
MAIKITLLGYIKRRRTTGILIGSVVPKLAVFRDNPPIYSLDMTIIFKGEYPKDFILHTVFF